MRWTPIRFSLRRLLLVVLAIGLALAITVPLVHRSQPITQTETHAMTRINASEWCFVDAHQYGFPEGTAFVLSVHVRCPDPDAEFSGLAQHLNDLRRVDIYATGTHLTDDGLLALHGVATLRELLVDDTNVTDAGIQLLKRQENTCKVVHTSRNWYPPD